MYIHIYIYIYMLKWQHIYIYRDLSCHFKRKVEAEAIFLNSFTVCSSCKQNFVVCMLSKKQREVIRLQMDYMD